MPSEAIYRYEVAKQGRAGCQVAACKEAGEKIQKGELRFGTLVTIKEYTNWKWKHWGCVTPRQIQNIVDQLGGLDGLDLDSDLDILDGYEELPTWAQDKIKRSLAQGHVDDEDWKGEPEKNRPGQKGLHTKASRAQLVEEVSGGSDAETDQKPKKKARKTKKRKAEDDDESEAEAPKQSAKKAKKAVKEEEVDDENMATPPAKTKAEKSKKVKKEEIDTAADVPAPAESKAKKAKEIVKEEEPEDEDDQPLPAKGKKKKATVKQDGNEESIPTAKGRKKTVKEDPDQAVAPVKSKKTAAVKQEPDGVPATSKDKQAKKAKQSQVKVEEDEEMNDVDANVEEAPEEGKVKTPATERGSKKVKSEAVREEPKEAAPKLRVKKAPVVQDSSAEPEQGRRRSARSRT